MLENNLGKQPVYSFEFFIFYVKAFEFFQYMDCSSWKSTFFQIQLSMNSSEKIATFWHAPIMTFLFLNVKEIC